MDCPSCRKVVFSGDLFCRHCGGKLPEVVTAGKSEEVMQSMRKAMDGAAAAVDRAWKRTEPHVHRAAEVTHKAAESAWREAQPHLDKAVKAFEDAMKSAATSKPVTKARETTAPVARAASKSARAAARRASKAAKPVVADVAEAVESGARKVKDRARHRAKE